MIKYLVGAIGVIFILLLGCRKEPVPKVDPDDLTHISYMPTNYEINRIDFFPEMEIPVDNPLTLEGVTLGRRLFYDPILSKDSTMSCSSCHLPSGSFTDNLAVSEGVDEIAGKRSSMSLLNVGYYSTGLFWDGRSDNLEEQALLPVEDPIELHHDWGEVESQLKRHQDYPTLFRKAFGIDHKNDITRELTVKALAQFERSLVSSGNSKWDRVQRNEDFFTDLELEGYLMYFDLDPDLPDAECAHCHSPPLFTTNEYINNGIQEATDLESFKDMGRGKITESVFDNGKFRVPTLRNIQFSAPYMHDGRFETLEEVLDHYNSGGHFQPNRDALIRPLGLSDRQMEAILAFLNTLSDPDFNQDNRYQSPF